MISSLRLSKRILVRAASVAAMILIGHISANGQPCPDFDAPVSLGVAQPAALTEASGLVASRKNADVLWVHNDSPDINRLFALTTSGAERAEFILQGASQYDWEDIALGPGPGAGPDYLYVGDIGDNAAARANIVVYRLPEPVVDGLTSGTITLTSFDAMTLTYPGGPRNAETLLCDPVTDDLFIVTKTLTATAEVYRKPAPHAPGASVLQFIETIQPGIFTTGGDVSPSGDAILIRTMSQVRFWPRAAGQTIGQALAGTPCMVPLAVEPQGEAIGFAPGGCGYYTTSEGANQPIFYIKRNNYCAAGGEWTRYE